MRCAIVHFLVSMIGSATLIAAPAARTAKPAIESERLTRLEAKELVVPFYEGILVQQPLTALPEARLARLRLAYPGPLSVPFVAWQSGDDNWTAIYCDDLNALPAQLEFTVNGDRLEVSLSCPPSAEINRLHMHGSWEQVVRAVRQKWKVKGPKIRLADRFNRIDFYVQQWISPHDDPPLRVDWTIDQLRSAMRKTPAMNLVHVYGFDPAGIDLAGSYFWSDAALDRVKRVLQANPQVCHLAWLNLRTYKYDIPRLRREVALTPQIQAMAKRFDGKIREDDNYQYKAIDMCLASEQWQASRITELDRLMDAGFKVIQLDEFPIPPVWNVVACQAKGHLHQPGDAGGEWSKSIAFIRVLSGRAQQRGVLLTCEEPSAALLPYISGYIDRQFNDNIDLYWPCHRSPRFKTLPIFSTMFSDVTTPYTDADGADPGREPPKTWLQSHKMITRD